MAALGLPFKRWVNIDPFQGTVEFDRYSRPSQVRDWKTTLCMQVFGAMPTDVTDTEATSLNAQSWLGYDLPYGPAEDYEHTLRFYALNRNQTATADDGTGFKLLNHTGTFLDVYSDASVEQMISSSSELEPSVAPFNCYDPITRRNFLVYVDQKHQWVRSNGKYQDNLVVVEYEMIYDTSLSRSSYVQLQDLGLGNDFVELGRWTIPIELPVAMSDFLQAPAASNGGAFARYRGLKLEDASPLSALSLDRRFTVFHDICVMNGIFYVFFAPASMISFTLEDGFLQDTYFNTFFIHPSRNNVAQFYPNGYFLDPDKILFFQRIRGSMSILLWPSKTPDFSDPKLLGQTLSRRTGYDGLSWDPRGANSSTRINFARASADNVNGSGTPVLFFPEMNGSKISRIFMMYCTRALVTDANGKKYPSTQNRWVLYSYGFRDNSAGPRNRVYPRRGEVEFTAMQGPELVYAPVDSKSHLQFIGNLGYWNTYEFNYLHTDFRRQPINWMYSTGPSWKGVPYFGGPYNHKLSRLTFPIRVRLVSEYVTLDRQIRSELAVSGETETRTSVFVKGEDVVTADVQTGVDDTFFVEETEDYSFYYNGYQYHILVADRVSRIRWKLQMRVTIA